MTRPGEQDAQVGLVRQGRPAIANYGLFYFLYFAVVAAMIAYLPLYLDHRGYSSYQIGALLALIMATRILAPNLWGWIADRTGARSRLVRLGAVIAASLFLLIPYCDQIGALALVLIGFSAFWNAVLPQVEVLTLQHLGNRPLQYSYVRLWGSVGFIVAVNGLGWLWQVWSIEAFAMITAGLLAALALACFGLSAPAATDASPGRMASTQTFLRWLSTPEVSLFLLVVMLTQLSFGPYYTFFTLHLQMLGYSSAEIGIYWSLGVLAEIVLFTQIPTLLKSFPIWYLMALALGLTAVRWLVLGYAADHWLLLTLAQLTHAAGFALNHACAIGFVHRACPAQAAGQGQAAYSTASFGLGGALGAWSAGLVLDQATPAIMFALASLVAAAAGLLCLLAGVRRYASWG